MIWIIYVDVSGCRSFIFHYCIVVDCLYMQQYINLFYRWTFCHLRQCCCEHSCPLVVCSSISLGVVESWRYICSHLLGNAKLFPWGCLALANLKMFASLVCAEWYFTVVLICLCLIPNEADNFFCLYHFPFFIVKVIGHVYFLFLFM